MPTPKQEQLAYHLARNNKYYKIICIGASIGMLSGEEKIVPKILYNYEFLWRLRFDTRRRLVRLINSLSNYIFLGIILRKVFKIKVKFFF